MFVSNIISYKKNYSSLKKLYFVFSKILNWAIPIQNIEIEKWFNLKTLEPFMQSWKATWQQWIELFIDVFTLNGLFHGGNKSKRWGFCNKNTLNLMYNINISRHFWFHLLIIPSFFVSYSWVPQIWCWIYYWM